MAREDDCRGTLTAQAYRLVPSAILIGGLDEKHQPFDASEWCLQMITLALRSCMAAWQALMGNACNQPRHRLLQRTVTAQQQQADWAHSHQEAGNHQLCGQAMRLNSSQWHGLPLLAADSRASLHAGMGEKQHNRHTLHTRHPLPHPIYCQHLLCKRAHLRGICNSLADYLATLDQPPQTRRQKGCHNLSCEMPARSWQLHWQAAMHSKLLQASMQQ